MKNTSDILRFFHPTAVCAPNATIKKAPTFSHLSFILTNSWWICPSDTSYTLHPDAFLSGGSKRNGWYLPDGELLSGATVAAAEVYHHGHLISQPHLRDQQGQFSALPTLLSFFDEVRPHPLDEVSRSVSAAKRGRALRGKHKCAKQKSTKLLLSERLRKNAERGFNEPWQSTSSACPSGTTH